MKPQCERVTVSDVPVDCTDFDYVLKVMEDSIKAGEVGRYVSFTNTESMYHALHDRAHMDYVKGSDFSFCDGIGSVIAGIAWGHDLPRLNGPIFVLRACEYGLSRGWRHFFYGGDVGVADTMAAKLTERYPKLINAGTYCPPFRPLTPEEEVEVARIIAEAKPDILWVGLGLLKQERWIAAHLKTLNVPWMAGVGASFDYHSGNVPWAPDWIQKIGMEWLFRLIIQPRLRYKRYWWSFVFMFRSLYEGLLDRLKQKFARG